MLGSWMENSELPRIAVFGCLSVYMYLPYIHILVREYMEDFTDST